MQNILTLRNTGVLNYKTARAVLAQTLILAAALVLPSVCHYFKLSVSAFVPMHWPILFAGLIYGRKSGLMLGIAAPVISFLISGMPAGAMLPIMILELATYGFIAGFAKEKLNLNSLFAVICALFCGKLVYIGAALMINNSFSLAFVKNAAFIIILQIILLPFLADAWISKK
ncbi:MAG: ECF transporter S component [Elusimicrobiota bacterium]|jgi:hypothetical protein|nr:ECF transporter S component [Elusimicrobiota bacterium]